jgi:hypothetical protein
MWFTVEIYKTYLNREIMWQTNLSVLQVNKVVFPLYTPWMCIEGVEVQFHSLLILAPVTGKCSAYWPNHITTAETATGTNWVGDYLGTRGDLLYRRDSRLRSPSPLPSHHIDCSLNSHFCAIAVNFSVNHATGQEIYCNIQLFVSNVRKYLYVSLLRMWHSACSPTKPYSLQSHEAIQPAVPRSPTACSPTKPYL